MAARFVPAGIAPPPALRALYRSILIYPYYYAAQVDGLSLSTAAYKCGRSGTEAFAERAVPMSKFPSLPANPEMIEVFATHSEGFESLCDYHDTILRGPSPLSIAERELIAAYVSGLNQCDFSYDSHRSFAEVHGIAPECFALLVSDPAAAGIDERLLPLLAYARKLTQAPSSVSDSDADDVYAAGWSEKALFHTIAVTGIFNLMNRLVEGTGITTDPARRNATRDRAANEQDNLTPYAGFARSITRASECGILGDSMMGGT
ncbi:carboxymuconolactone decarboxylase family protein [Parasphingorhabdus sp.]|uniref:carboxymuconolactone decarboxylase family protein n=1 Tax=Parasphingorhabdus sp. TaxID=2709688 RepID=UPI003A90347A